MAQNVGSGWEDVLRQLADVLRRVDAAIADLSHPGAVDLLERRTLARLGYAGPTAFPG